MSIETLERSPSATAAPAGGIRATLNYLKKSSERPRTYTYDPPPGVPRYSGEVDARQVIVRDARLGAAAAGLTLDQAGFQLLSHTSALSRAEDYADEERVRSVYYGEAAELLRRTTGAEKVLIFDHTLRDSTASPGRAALREPVRRVHDDQTFHSAPNRVRKHLSPEEAELRLKQRFAIINLWRPLATVERLPLALCDTRSISLQDMVPSDLVYPDKVGEIYSFTWNPNHRWYWFPRLRPDEALLLKIYDSREDGVARFTAHTAFEDPTGSREAPPRRSIELRALVFWPAGK